MRDKCKKILSGVLAATVLGATLGLTACGGERLYKQEALDGYTKPATAAVSNGGFAVEYGDYVYFINGQEDYTAENEFGEVKKGALMRISKSVLNGDLSATYEKAETVVPMLFVAQNFDSGIYIYDEYVYYATPTTDKNMSGVVESSWIDFKRAKVDGSEAMKSYYFRLSDNAAKYRFVEVDGVVYCLYEESSSLKSFNTQTGETTILVSGAKSSFYYDTTDLTNPNVYYTMAVSPDAEAPNPLPSASYDQLYCVNAAATVESVDASAAKYTVKNGATYDFNEEYMKDANEEAEENETDAPYDFDDYTTYPYVNLGNLVLDGIGSGNDRTQFNEKATAIPSTPEGYTYTISSYQNGGVYFTRTEVVTNSSDAVNTELYFIDKDGVNADWNAIEANKDLTVIALDTTNTASAIFYKEGDAHKYLYLSDSALYRAEQPDSNGRTKTTRLATTLSGATLWKKEGNHLYYYGSGTNGNNLSRIDVTGTDDDYHNLIETEAYQPVTVAYIDWNSSWYKPEIFGDTVLYSNAQSFGSTAYNYIYAAKLTDIAGENEKYEAVQDYIDEYSENADLQAAMQYYFRTGKTAAFDAVADLYDKYQKDEFKKFTENTDLAEESRFIVRIAAMTDADEEAIEEAWAASLLSESEDETESEGLPTWAIVLICVGGALVVACGVAIPLVIVSSKKKAKAKEAEATVNAYKKRIDTTDDKSIDVYADDEESTEEPTEEAQSEEVIEEATEDTETVKEIAEEPTEETVVEAVEDAAAEEEKKDE